MKKTKSKLVWFTYHAAERESRMVQVKNTGKPPWRSLHQIRDATAFAEFSSILYPLGYAYEGLIFNIQPDLFEQDESEFEPHEDDLLLILTRPPLDDPPQPDDPPKELVRGQRRIERSDTKLEKQIHSCLRQFFVTCTRSKVRLQPKISEKISGNYKTRGLIEFQTSGGASYTKDWVKNSRYLDEDLKDGFDRTAGYIAYTPNCNGKFGVLCVFAMDGVGTLLLSNTIRKDQKCRDGIKKILESGKSCFILAEWNVHAQEKRPMHLDSASAFCDTESSLKWIFEGTLNGQGQWINTTFGFS